MCVCVCVCVCVCDDMYGNSILFIKIMKQIEETFSSGVFSPKFTEIVSKVNVRNDVGGIYIK